MITSSDNADFQRLIDLKIAREKIINRMIAFDGLAAHYSPLSDTSFRILPGVDPVALANELVSQLQAIRTEINNAIGPESTTGTGGTDKEPDPTLSA